MHNSASALPTDGCTIIHDVFFDDGCLGPWYAAGMNIFAIVNSKHGRVYSISEIKFIVSLFFEHVQILKIPKSIFGLAIGCFPKYHNNIDLEFNYENAIYCEMLNVK